MHDCQSVCIYASSRQKETLPCIETDEGWQQERHPENPASANSVRPVRQSRSRRMVIVETDNGNAPEAPKELGGFELEISRPHNTAKPFSGYHVE